MFAFPEYTDYETMTTPQSSATAKPSETERKIFLCNRLKQTCLLRQLTLVKTLDAASCDVFRQFYRFFLSSWLTLSINRVIVKRVFQLLFNTPLGIATMQSRLF